MVRGVCACEACVNIWTLLVGATRGRCCNSAEITTPQATWQTRHVRGRDARPSASQTSSCYLKRCFCFLVVVCICCATSNWRDADAQDLRLTRTLVGTVGGKVLWLKILFFCFIFYFYFQWVQPVDVTAKKPKQSCFHWIQNPLDIKREQSDAWLRFARGLLWLFVFFTQHPVTFSSLFLPTRMSLITI